MAISIIIISGIIVSIVLLRPGFKRLLFANTFVVDSLNFGEEVLNSFEEEFLVSLPDGSEISRVTFGNGRHLAVCYIKGRFTPEDFLKNNIKFEAVKTENDLEFNIKGFKNKSEDKNARLQFRYVGDNTVAVISKSGINKDLITKEMKAWIIEDREN